MLFKACVKGEYEPGMTYHGPDMGYAYVNALSSILLAPRLALAPPTATVEVRLEGVTSRDNDGVFGGETTVVRVLTFEERCAWCTKTGAKRGFQMRRK